jgi:hypothetical protein
MVEVGRGLPWDTNCKCISPFGGVNELSSWTAPADVFIPLGARNLGVSSMHRQSVRATYPVLV